MMIRVADYIVKRIAQEGVRHIFYVPGGQCVYLMDALRRSEEITGIGMHHEQACAMAALAYSEYSNNYGACIVTTGCAGTNTLTGVLHAWQDSIPMIVVSGQQNYESTIKASGLPLRQFGVQEADTETLVKPITKYAVTVTSAEEIAYCIDKAIFLSRDGRKGPVWLDVPLNIQNAMIDEDKQKRFVPESAENEKDIGEDIRFLLGKIKESKRPIIHAGYGVRSAHAEEELKKFSGMTRIPVTLSRRTYNMMASDDPQNMGILNGTAGGHRYANFAVQNSDLLIVIGSRLSKDTIGGNAESFAREATVFVVDNDEIEHKKNLVKIDRVVISDAKTFLEKLNSEIVKDDQGKYQASPEWIGKCNHWKTLFDDYKNAYTERNLLDAKYAMRQITRSMPENSVVVSDAGFTGAAASACSVFKDGDGLVHSFAQGEMGFSIPGACGVAPIASAPVIAFEGDGSFMMNLQELQTIVRNRYNIKIVVINNNGYSGVRHGQKAHFRGKSYGTDPSNGVDFPSFKKLADAFGMAYYEANDTESLESGIQAIFDETGPCIFEVFTDPDQFDLHNALVMCGKRKVGFRPIEDQSPFIDREVFFREMIIEPMEESSGKPM